MSIRSNITQFFGGDATTVRKLESRLDYAQQELTAAETEARAAFLEFEAAESDTARKRAGKAREMLTSARERVAELNTALAEARSRKANAEAQDRARALREKREAIRKALTAAVDAGHEFDKAIQHLAEKFASALEAQAAVMALTSSPDIRRAFFDANCAAKHCIAFWLNNMVPGISTPVTDPKTAVYAARLPTRDIVPAEKDAAA